MSYFANHIDMKNNLPRCIVSRIRHVTFQLAEAVHATFTKSALNFPSDKCRWTRYRERLFCLSLIVRCAAVRFNSFVSFYSGHYLLLLLF